MRVLVCGGRNFEDSEMLDMVLDEVHAETPITLVIQGLQSGADTLAARWADRHHIPCDGYRAEWRRYGKPAGPIRNTRMLTEGEPDLVIAAPGGSGTADMVNQARRANVPVREIAYAR